jgi:hypothetical protein
LVVGLQDQPPRISWECPACGEAGSIEGWQGLPPDLSGVARPDEDDEFMSVVLPEKTYQLLLDELYMDRQCERLLYSARLGPDGVELSGPEEDFEELVGVPSRPTMPRPRSSSAAGTTSANTSSPAVVPGWSAAPM